MLDPRHHRSRSTDGYVLLVVMAVLVLLVTSLAALAQVTLRRGLQAADAERSLQMRWGARTLRTVMLNQAPVIFEARELLTANQTSGEPPPTSIRAAITLNGVTFDLLLGDEDAKLSLNAIYHHAGQERTEQAIATLVGPMPPGVIRLMPSTAPQRIVREQRTTAIGSTATSATDLPEPSAAFRSWG